MSNEKQAASVLMRPAWRAFSLHFFAILVFLVGPALNPDALLTPVKGQIFAAIFLVFILLKRYLSFYELTPQHIIIKNMGSAPMEFNFDDIRRVDLVQGAIKQRLGYGSLRIYCQQRLDKPALMYGILLPDKVRQYILNAS